MITKLVKKGIAILLVAALTITSTATASGTDSDAKGKKPTSIRVKAPLSEKGEEGEEVSATLMLKKGDTFKLKTRVFPEYASEKLTYKSSKKAIVSISSEGEIKAEKVGRTTITIRSKINKRVSAVVKVTVVKKLKKVKKIRLNKTILSLSTAGTSRTAKLKAEIVSPKKPTTKKLNWISSNKKVATVNKKGVVTAKKAGAAMITVTSKDGRGAKDVCRVIVTAETAPSPNIKEAPTRTGIFTTPSNSPGSVVTPSNSPGSVVTPSNSPGSAVTPSNSPDSSVTPSNSPGSSATPSNSPGSSATPDNSPGSSATPSNSPGSSATPSNSPNVTASPEPDAVPVIVVPDERTGIKQGETLQLAAKDEKTGAAMTDVTWSVNTLEGVSVDNTGLLTVAKTAAAGAEITVTATNSNGSDTAVFIIIENKVPEITENMHQMNQGTADAPLGLTYRSDDACSPTSDPERGEVVRFDAGKGYTSDSNDELAWMVVDPMYAGKTVTISAYMKYDAIPDVSVMDLVIKEGWSDGDSASKENADPDTWYYVSGTCILPENNGRNYDGELNRLYIARDSVHLGSAGADAVNAVYYIDDLTLTVEKSEIESVELYAAEDADTIYQNHTLQFTSKVNGADAPMQKVIYSIDPPVEGATISENGLLTVRNVAADTEITVKAAAYEDPSKYATKTIRVLLEQTIDSIEVTAPGNPTTILQPGTLQFSAEVTGTGEPDLSVSWSLDNEVDDVSISEDGLLTVGENAPARTKLTIRATSNFDKTKSDTYEITIIAGEITDVSIAFFGNSDYSIVQRDSVNLFARVSVVGNVSDDVIWSLKEEIDGVTLEANDADSRVCTLTVADSVSSNTVIEVQAVSREDEDKKDSITITVSNTAAKALSIDDTTVTYWQDFEGSTTPKAYTSDGTFYVYNTEINRSYFSAHTASKNKYTGRHTTISSVFNYPVTGTGISTSQYKSSGFTGYLNSTEDYYSFVIRNDENQEQTYTLSFLADFLDVGYDDVNDVKAALQNVLAGDKNAFNYKLPLKVVDGETGDTLASASLTLRCYADNVAYYVDFQEFIATVTVPAGGSKILKLMAESLPNCFSNKHKSDKPGVESIPHPVQVCIDNISIVKRDMTNSRQDSTPVINLKVGDKYPINVTKASGDAVAYTTNDFLSYLTHTHLGVTATSQPEQLICPIDGEIPRIADVDYETGMLTALGAGQTMVTAAITSGGDTTYKQCIINVTE